MKKLLVKIKGYFATREELKAENKALRYSNRSYKAANSRLTSINTKLKKELEVATTISR